MTDRNVWLVGSMAAPDAETAMRKALSTTGPYLRALPDGETDRPWWIAHWLFSLNRLPFVETTNPLASFTTYEDVQSYQLTGNHELSARDLHACIPLKEAFTTSYPLFRKLRAAAGRADLSFQATGIPSAADWAMAAFGDQGLEEPVFGPMALAQANVIQACADMAAGDVVFQLEMPVPVAAVAYGPGVAYGGAAEKTAADLAALITRVPALTEPGTRFALHLCLGDLFHTPIGRPGTIEPVVMLANALTRAWPDGHPLEEVHIPCAAASDPPSMDPGWYAPLGDLKLPPGTALAAGFVHESLDLRQHRELLGLIEHQAGRQVDVATTCGLARRPDPGQVDDALGKLAALATS